MLRPAAESTAFLSIFSPLWILVGIVFLDRIYSTCCEKPGQLALRKLMYVLFELIILPTSHCILRIMGLWSDPNAHSVCQSILIANSLLARLMSGELLH